MLKIRAAFSSIFSAVHRAWLPIMLMALTYLAGVLIGIGMVQARVPLALNTRDQIVGQAYNGSDPTINALQSGQPVLAALSDFSRNLFVGAVPDTVGGLGIVIPFPLAAYRGWVGGIVSVDANHSSRLAQPGEAIYYLITLILQLIPYSLAGGAGVSLGLAYYRKHSGPHAGRWYSLPRLELLDVGKIYLLVVPLFFIASLWEFLFR